MQSMDDQNKIVFTQGFDSRNELQERLLEAIKKAEDAGAVSHSIGILPTKDQVVVIQGLRYKVMFVNRKNGELRLKLELPGSVAATQKEV